MLRLTRKEIVHCACPGGKGVQEGEVFPPRRDYAEKSSLTEQVGLPKEGSVGGLEGWGRGGGGSSVAIARLTFKEY